MKLLPFLVAISIFVFLSLSLAAGEKHTNARNDHIQEEPRVRRRRGSKRRNVKEKRSSGIITDNTVDENRSLLKCKGSSTCGNDRSISITENKKKGSKKGKSNKSESRSIGLGCGKGDKGNCDRNIGQDRSFGCGKGNKGNCDRSIGQDRSFGCGKGDKGNCDRNIGQDRGFALQQQVSVQETRLCVLFQSEETQIAIDHPDVDDQCLDNSCSGGCCRRLDRLVCDESDSLPFATCICNSNTANDHIRSPGTGGGAINVVQEDRIIVIPDNVVTLSIIDIVISQTIFSSFLNLVIYANLVTDLNEPGPFTVFAPTNAAFDKLSTEIVTCLQAPENINLLLQLLTYHIIPGKVLSSTLVAGNYISIQGQPITISTAITINNDANIVGVEVEARNGVIHTIDTVLIPEWLVSQIESSCADPSLCVYDKIRTDTSFSTFFELVGKTGLDDFLRGSIPFTVFVPTNDAFVNVPADVLNYLLKDENKNVLYEVLTYHLTLGKMTLNPLADGNFVTLQGQPIVISNYPLRINNVNIIRTDTGCETGIMHTINTVLIPEGILPKEESITIVISNRQTVPPGSFVQVVRSGPDSCANGSSYQSTPEAALKKKCFRDEDCTLESQCCHNVFCVCGSKYAACGCLPPGINV